MFDLHHADLHDAYFGTFGADISLLDADLDTLVANPGTLSADDHLQRVSHSYRLPSATSVPYCRWQHIM